MFAVCAAVLTLSARSAYADDSKVSSIDIDVLLSEDGSALVREVWDVEIYYGTEWYLERANLGDIRISGLQVSDETGLTYDNIGEWDINRSMIGKAGRCGIVSKRDGCELCWGLGSYGHHCFTIEYRMSNVVKSMDDFDCLHIQFVSPGINPRPEHARVRIHVQNHQFSEETCGIWAFGYVGEINFDEGSIVAETSQPFRSDEYSMIALVRFAKGLFNPTSRLEGPFQKKLDEAFAHSDYEEFLASERRNKIKTTLIAIFSFLAGVFSILATVISVRRRNERIFGVRKLKEIGYERDLPFDGNLYETRYVLAKVNRFNSEGEMAGAIILKMVKDGFLELRKNADGKVDIAFNEQAPMDKLNESDREFLGFLRESAGSDGVLQDREFSKWAARNYKKVTSWVENLGTVALSELSRDGYFVGNGFSEEGQKHARRAIGFKKFLKDFTLIGERQSYEVALWKDYIIYAALFGIADKVAKELKDIDPKAFETYVGYDYPTMRYLLRYSHNMNTGIERAVTRQQNATSVRGGGGFSSFGGGGGFSGGGFGGGAR